MASPETLDFEKLLTPISQENPAGEDLAIDQAFDSIYQQITTARSDASTAERNALRDGADTDLLVNNLNKEWEVVLKLAPEVIAQHSKDLRVAVFLLEALVRDRGFVGLRDGFRLVRRLVEDFWDDLHPRPDEDGVMTRVAPLASLNGEDSPGPLIRPIGRVPIVQGRTRGPYSLLHHKTARLLEQGKGPSGQDDAVTKEMFDIAVHETPPEWFADLLDDLTECMKEFEDLCKVLKEKCGEEDGFSLAPPSSNIRKALQECLEGVREIAPELPPDGGDDDGDGNDNDGDGDGDDDDGGRSKGSTGEMSVNIETRQDAFRTLQRTADFFRRTEPHSPVSYALEKAVRWGRMSLPELLKELVEDESPRKQIFKLVGIEASEEEKKS